MAPPWPKATVCFMTRWHSQLKIRLRWVNSVGKTLGMNALGKLMVVVWTERDGDIRLISVRKAGPKERRDYEKGS
jgi:uncharacterized DUF497 family protein